MDFAALLAAADRAALSTLGDAIRYEPSPMTGEAVDVRGIFDAVYVRVEAGGASVSSSGPAVFLRLSDLPGDPEEDDDALVTARGTEYRVRESHKDGQGGVLLMLREVE